MMIVEPQTNRGLTQPKFGVVNKKLGKQVANFALMVMTSLRISTNQSRNKIRQGKKSK